MQPLLLVLEDLHWADRGTLDLLSHLTRNLEGARLLVVGTYRDVEVDRSHPLSATLAELRRAHSFQRVPLRGLTVDEVHRMMNIIRGQEVPWGRAEAIHRQTEGNPLFVQEVLRYLVEEGLVVREGGRYGETEAVQHDIRAFLQEYNFASGEDAIGTQHLVVLLEAAVVAESREVAAPLAERLAPLADMLPINWLVCLPRLLGAAAVLLGEPEKALTYYQQAVEACTKIRFRPELALTRLQLAELLLEESAKGEASPLLGAPLASPHPPGAASGAPTPITLRTEAIEHLDLAIQEFRAMKMQPSLERALKHRGLLKA